MDFSFMSFIFFPPPFFSSPSPIYTWKLFMSPIPIKAKHLLLILNAFFIVPLNHNGFFS